MIAFRDAIIAERLTHFTVVNPAGGPFPAFHISNDEAEALANPGVLAAKVPEACPDCTGEWAYLAPICDHPNAPTIGTLLAYGWNVATAVKPVMPRNTFDHGYYFGQVDLLDALRKVEVQP